MGSLASRPKVPTTQVIYTAAPATAVSTIDTATSTSTEDETPTASEQRKSSLLARERGRTGTIETSFRGILETANNQSARKTLLGE